MQQITNKQNSNFMLETSGGGAKAPSLLSFPKGVEVLKSNEYATIPDDVPGVRVITPLRVPLNLISTRDDDGDHINGRKIDQKIVGRFIKADENGDYDVKIYIAPTVILGSDGKFHVVAGEHKTEMHIQQEKDYMIVLLVEFFQAKSPKTGKTKSAKYWQTNWQSIENNVERDTFVRNPRNDEQIVFTTLKQIEEGDVKPTQEEVEESLIDQEVKPAEISMLIVKILKEWNKSSNNKTKISIPHIWSVEKKTKKAIQKEYGKKKIRLSTKQNIKFNTGNEVVVSQQFINVSDGRAYDNGIKQLLENVFEINPNAKVTIWGNVKHHDKTHIKTVQKNKRNTIVKLCSKSCHTKEFIKFVKENMRFEWLKQ